MTTLPIRAMAIGVAAVAMANGSAVAQHKHHTPDELMELLKGAAPPAVFDNATILDMQADGSMSVLRKGTNGWTCMDPGDAPMCADAGAAEWAKAYMSKGPAPQKLGFIYMLPATTAPATPTPTRPGKRLTTIGSRRAPM